MRKQPVPFTLHVPDAAIADLRERLARTRFPDQAGEPWAYGSDVAYMQELARYWQSAFDWRAAEAALNAFPQYKLPLHGIELHFLHVPGKGPDPCPLAALARLAGLGARVLGDHPAPDRSGAASAAIRPMRSPWWRLRCRATASRSRPASSALASRRSPTALPT